MYQIKIEWVDTFGKLRTVVLTGHDRLSLIESAQAVWDAHDVTCRMVTPRTEV